MSEPVAAQSFPPLPADLTAALKRLKLATVRALAPEVLATAKVQRWTPEETLRTLVEAEIAARDTTNLALRRKAAGMPAVKSFDAFNVNVSSVSQATVDHLASLDWIGRPGRPGHIASNVCLIGPAGTGKTHLLLAVGHSAVDHGLRVRYLTAATLVETLYRGLADNSVGRVIDTLLRHDLVLIDELGFAPLDATGSQLLFRFIAAAYETTSLGVASHRPFQDWGQFLPDQSTAVSLVDRLLHHVTTVITNGESYRMLEARGSRPTT